MRHSEKSLELRQTGGNGYYLNASEAFNYATHGQLAMNIDLLDDTDGTTFSVLEAMQEDGTTVDVLSAITGYTRGLMGLNGIAVLKGVRNFTYGVGFTKITANKAIWINLNNNM